MDMEVRNDLGKQQVTAQENSTQQLGFSFGLVNRFWFLAIVFWLMVFFLRRVFANRVGLLCTGGLNI